MKESYMCESELKLEALVIEPSGSIVPSDEDACPSCAAHHPGPQSAGNLQVDPEIRLPSPGMDVSVSYFYNSGDPTASPYGYGRTISCNHRLTARNNHTHVQMLRGDGSGVQYKQAETGNYELSADLSWLGLSLKQEDGHWVETNGDGVKTFYPVLEDGKTSKVSYIEDAVGNRHTYTYDSNGLLTTLTDTVGRQVTFTYNSNNLLSEITDWAGRKNLFTYDITTNPRKPVLIKVTGPTGCQTKYKHNDEGLLSGIVDPNGYETNYQYDKRGRVISRSIVGIGETKYDYDFTALSGTGQYTARVNSSGTL